MKIDWIGYIKYSLNQGYKICYICKHRPKFNLQKDTTYSFTECSIRKLGVTPICSCVYFTPISGQLELFK